MENAKRTFIAIKIQPGKLLAAFVEDAKIKLNSSAIKWVERGNLHVTIRFFGNSSHRQIRELQFHLEEIAKKISPFFLKIHCADLFIKNKQPQVLFLNIDGGQLLKQLAIEVEKVAVSTGFISTIQPFTPHLTLARIKYTPDVTDIYSFVNQFRVSEFQNDLVTEIIFYESILQNSGPIYQAIQKFYLNRI